MTSVMFMIVHITISVSCSFSQWNCTPSVIHSTLDLHGYCSLVNCSLSKFTVKLLINAPGVY